MGWSCYLAAHGKEIATTVPNPAAEESANVPPSVSIRMLERIAGLGLTLRSLTRLDAATAETTDASTTSRGSTLAPTEGA